MISVIIPVYKAELFLERCVSSVLNQTYRDIELILVNDGSPDNCGRMCDEYVLKDNRVRVIHKKNGGVSTARNAGLDIAKGDYITFVDSDDYIDACMYEKMMAIAQRYDCDVVMCDCVKEYGTHNLVYSHPIRSGFYNAEQLRREYYPHLLMMENVEYPATISNWTILWKSKFNTSQMRYEPRIRFSEDLLFGAKLLRRANSFYYMKDQPFYHYVMNPVSASHSFVPDKWNDYQLLHRRIREEFENDPVFEFRHQIDLCLLFFVYNTVGEINNCGLPRAEKKSRIMDILCDNEVKSMFRRLDIDAIPISSKLKIITRIYKYRIGIGAYMTYCDRKAQRYI